MLYLIICTGEEPSQEGGSPYTPGLFLGIKYMLVTWLFSVLAGLPEGRQNDSYIWDTFLCGRLLSTVGVGLSCVYEYCTYHLRS